MIFSALCVLFFSCVQRRADEGKLDFTMRLIEQFYVEPLTADSLAELAIPAVLAELDPHSQYIPARDLQAANESLEGEFDGIGVMFNMATDTVVVLNVIPQGPSDKAGVQNGDRIVRIDDSLVAGRKINQNAVVKRLRGPRGTQVKLGIERVGAGSEIPIVVTRDAIPLNALDAAFMVEPGVAFVKLSTFSRVSAEELHKALVELREQGMERLVLDLRGNSGGYLDQAIVMANMFLPKGDLIVYTVDRDGRQMREYSKGKGAFTELPMAVIIDEGSASSSEILAGAVQDNDRGTIVGRRSFGKGLVQREIPYGDGSAIRLTIARYYTPSGRSIQKPFDDYDMDLYNRYVDGEMFAADSTRQDTVNYFTKGGRIVHGGGGIMPDRFVGVDTVGMTGYYRRVNGQNLIARFTLDWGDRHREEMNAVKDVTDLRKMFARHTGLMDEFVSYAARNGVKPDGRDLEKSRTIIETQLRALIGRNTAADYNGFWDNYFAIDPAMREAVNIVKNEKEER